MRHYILVFISDPYKEYISRLISMKREKSCSFNCKKRNYLYHPFEKKSKLYYTVQVRRTIIKGLLRNIVLTFTGGTLYLISSFLLPKWRLSKKKKIDLNWELKFLAISIHIFPSIVMLSSVVYHLPYLHDWDENSDLFVQHWGHHSQAELC